mgnify:CR=1 FL=1
MKRFNPAAGEGEDRSGNASKVFALLLILSAMFTAVSGDLIVEKEVVELGNPSKITVTREYDEFDSSQVSVVVPAPYEPENIQGEVSEGDITCSYRETFGKEIVCIPSVESSENYTVSISYTTSNIYTKNRFYSFDHQKRILVPTERYVLEVILPEGYGIISRDEGTPIEPKGAETGSEGRRIFVRWDMKNVSLGQSRDFQVNYQELNVFRNVFPNNMTSFVGLLVLLVAVLVAVYVKYMKEEDTIASILPVLKEDEKRVVMYLLDFEGECEQVELVKNLDYSKAKISRLVKDLEERGIIKKIKEGRKNRLVIKKAIGEIEED